MTQRSLGVRGQLTFVSVVLIVCAGLVGTLYLENQLRRDLESRRAEELFRQASALRALFEQNPAPTSISRETFFTAEQMARAAGVRFSFIDAAGVVRADSAVTKTALAGLANHAQRPEVQAARQGKPGFAHRYSTTLAEDALYVALPYDLGGTRHVVRVSMSTDAVEQDVRKLRWLLGVSGVLALVVAVLMSTLAAHLMTRALRRLVVQAKGLTEHRGPNQIPLSTSQEEIATLAGSLNHMARELEGTVQKLATERDRFQAVLDGMGGAVIAIDENRHITLVNRAALSLLGLSESPVDKPLVEVLRAPAIQNLLQAPVDPAHSIDFEIPGRPPRAINARASKAHLADDTVLVLYDVTDVRRLEKMRTDFVANASHELRTPVSVIQASAEALTSGALSDPARAERFAAAVYRNAERLSRLIADLLDLSRIESTRARPALRPVPVRDLLGHALETLSPIADSNGRRLSLGEVHEVSVLADEAVLEQVLTNLIDNAIKYTQPQGQVTLRARARESVVELSVEDDGPGIPDPHKERIFERFYRIDAGRSRELGGTGLGLSIVKNLVLRLGGQIHVEDVVPTGARFVVELPRAAPG